MRGRRTTAGMILIVILAMLTACSTRIEQGFVPAQVPGIAEASADNASPSAGEWGHPKGKVTVWSYYSGAEWIIPLIRSEYPDLEIEVATKSWNDYADNYLAALDQGNAPDVIFVENSMLGKLAGMKLFDDLSAPPYNGEAIADRFNESIMAPYRSLAGGNLLMLPLDVGPAVAYYRSDLFAEAGLPSEPEALGSYLADSGNWVTAARKLKQNGASIAATEWDSFNIAEYSSGFFDRDLSYSRNTSAFAAVIELGRSIRRGGLGSGLNPESEEGRAALNDGKIAMFCNGWWYQDVLKSAAPDTAGQWRITRLPLGLYGWAGSSGTAISVSSRNKPGAWAVVRTLADQIAGLLNATNPDGDPFYGGQKLQPLYAELVRNMPTLTPTPLDDKADKIWKQLTGSALDNDADPAEVLANIEQLTIDSLQSELRLLKAADDGT